MTDLPTDASGGPLAAAWRAPAVAAGPWHVVPSTAGARLFRKQGWRGYAAGIAAWAGARGLDLAALRVVDELPSAGAAAAPRPRAAEVLAIEPDPAGGRWTLALRVPFDLAIFHGHFPTVPIVPGAMLAGWAVALAAQHAGWAHGLASASAMKFRRIVQPGVAFRLELACARDRLDFRYASPDGLHATGTVLGGAA